MLASEVDRYLGWPGQAISYKVGERAWLRARAERARRRRRPISTSRRSTIGPWRSVPMGLEQLEREMAAPES